MGRVTTQYKLNFAIEMLKIATKELKNENNIRTNEYEGFCYTSRRVITQANTLKIVNYELSLNSEQFLGKIRYRVMQDIFDLVKEMYPKYLSNGAKFQKSWRVTGFWFASDENDAPKILNYRRRIKALERYIINLERGIKK